MSGPDNGDVWVIATLISAAGFFVVLMAGVIARDRAVFRQIRDGDAEVHARINRVKEEAQRDNQQTRQELTDYKLHVAREYASVEHLKEVENRLVKAIEKLSETVQDMPAQLARAIQETRGD